MAKTLEERRREMNEKYGRKEKEKENNTFSLPVSESEETKKENTSRMEALRKEMNEKYNLSSKVNDKFISDFMSDVNSLSKGYQDTYDGISWGTAASTYDAQAKTIADLRKRSGAIRQYLNKNKDSIDPESYKSWMTELDSTGEWMNSYLDSFSTAKKHYGQWKTEDEYNGWVEWYEDYEAKLNFNLDAGKRDIDYLQNELNAIETVEKQISAINQENQILNLAKAKGDRNAIAKLKANEEKLSQLNGALEDAFAKYGSKADLSSYISQKSAYYTLAERTQKAAELASVADVNSENYDPEFNMYAQMGADIKNPTAEEAEGRKAEVGNIVTYSRDNADMMAIGEVNGGGSSIGGRSIYSLMEKEEVDLYNYYLAKYGKDKAQEYLDSIEDTLQQRHGEKMYDTLKDKPLLEYSFGVLAGLDQFTSGVSSLFSNEDYIPTTSIQYASGMVREDLADNGIPLWYNFKTGEWEDKVLGNSSGQIFYDAITTTSNMLPSMLTSTALSAVAPGVGTVAGSVVLGASAAGNAKAEMLNLGYSKEQATTYGIMVGIAEGSMEYFLGHIPGLSKGDGIFSSLATKAVSKVDNALARVAIAIGGSFDEALEEGLQTIIEPWLKEIATGVDWDNPSVDEVLYSSLLGALSSIGLEGGTGAINLGINTVQKNQAIKNHGQTIIEKGGVDPLRELALEVAGVKQDGEANGLTREGKKLANLAEKVEKKATPKNVGKLSAKLEGTITKQNRTEIESALTEKGLSAKEAKLAADYLTDSKELTSEQISTIEGDKRFVEAIDEVLYGSDTNISTNSFKLAEARLGIGNKDTTVSESSAVGEEKASVTENPTAKEAATKSKFEVSEDGKTIVKETGKAVSVEEIVSNEGGKLMVKLDSGETVNASDLEFATAGEALAYEMVANMGVAPKTAWGLVKAYNPSSGVKPQTFAIDMPLAYQYGKIGYVKGLERLNLTPEQRNTAYVLGRDDVKASGRTWSDTSRKTPETNKSKAAEDGIIYDGFELNEDSLADIQKASLAGIRTLAKLSPALEIHITQSSVDENGKKYFIVNGKKQLAKNGVFRNGNEIYIDLNAGKGATGTMLYTVSHEVVHFIAENSYEDFKALADFLFEHYGEHNVPVDSLIKREIDKLKKGYESEGKALPDEKVLYMKAYEEVVANAMSKMFADPTSYEKLAKLKSENFDLWKKIGEAIKHILNKLKSLLGIYEGRTPDAMAAHYVDDFSIEVYNKLQDLYLKGFVNAGANYEASIGSRNLEDFADAKNTEGESLFQYKAMEADEDTYREMLKKWGKMTDSQISNLFLTIDNAMELIKDNLEALDYAWEADIDDRAFSPVKPNSDKLYQVSLDYSTLCRKRILQQTIIAHLQEALNKPLTREEGIAIRDALIALQEEGRQIEVACALCYVESARMKSPEQIKRFIDNREAVIKEFFAGKSGGDIKANIKKAEDDTRERLHKENPNGIKGKDGETMLDPRTAKLNQLPKKYADEIRSAKRSAKQAYVPTAEEQRIIEVAKGMTVSDFTSPEGLENLAKNYPSLFDAYTSYVRNATKSKGIENDTWWRAGDSMQIGDVLIANMNRENGLRSQSWSDFQVIHILDYIASTIELATRETKEQAYTKVPDYAELMGNTGVMINLSLIPTAKFNGTLDYDSVEGIDYKRALELRDKYHATVGTICIGVDNVQIKMLLGDITIDYVIPYHKSGMSAAIRKLMHIPTWSQYEEYQSEKNLSRAEAEEQAKKYGVKLLDASDPNYHKGTSFSEWFDIKEAQQIAKMENANPSDKAKQKKYGVMYGGYMAMQNAANNYLKLCAERGISPKFSHEKADFTAEENYWKLLIDRKMVDNITGEVIEQQTIKPIFDEKEVMRILNDELERYPKVKADQDYAIRKVTEGMLSGEIKGGMSAKDIAKVMQTPVDNVTKTNIIASAEGDELYSVDDYDDEEYSKPITLHDVEVLRSIGRKSINQFTSEDIKKAQKWAYKFYNEFGEKSPFFRAWFGDWRAESISGAEIVEFLYGESPKINYKDRIVTNGDMKRKITIDSDTIGDSLHYAKVNGDEKQIRKLLGKIDEILEKAIWLDTRISEKSSQNKKGSTQFMHYLYTPISINGAPFIAKLTVEEYDLTAKQRAYNLQRIEMSELSRAQYAQLISENKEKYAYSSDSLSVAQLFDFVKRFDETFKPNSVNPLLLNKDGSPKVFYHGTNAKFSVFDENRTSRTTKRYAEGFYFTAERRVAEKWGNFRAKEQGGNSYVIEAYLDVKKPLILTAKEYQRLGFDDKYRESVLQKLIAEKNDGIIIYPEEERIPGVFADSYNYEAGDSVYHNADKYGITDKDYAWWLNRAVENPDFTSMQVAVFRPEQVKSATENIGTFDNAEGDMLYSTDDDTDSFSNRSLLANALESVAQNDIERNKLKEYKEKIALIESEQEKLSEIRAKIKELSFAKGKRDTEAINKLRFQENQTANRINTYDRQLFNLEATAALKGVLQREKELARRKEAQKNKEVLANYREKAAKTQRELLTRYQESRKKGIEGRHKTEMRHKIRKVVGDLKALLLDPSKDKHVPIGLQKPVAEALDIINMDTVGADERVAKYNALIAKANDPDVIAELTKSRDRIELQGENLSDKLTALKLAYAEIKNSDDPLVSNSHNEAIEDLIANTAKKVGNTSIRDMSHEQLEAVYDMYKAVLATVRNANKMFKADKQEAITDNSELVKREVRAAGGHRDRVLKATKWLKKFGWNMLKPIYAMKMIGSDTLTRLYENVRKGEDTWAVDVNEAREFFRETARKYNYSSWDFEKQYSFKDSAGHSFSLSVEQIMSLYAYSKREQADEHLEFGGFIFDDSIEITEKNKLGIPMKYEVNDANPYRLRKSDLGEIISILDTDLQEVKGFVDEMQAFLSDVMGAKGNEVSLAMYDIKLFKEKNYFPLKTSKYFREFDPEKNGTPKIKNAGFSKKTVPQAGNPIILSNFMDVWANHVNDMSMYHAFVLPLEDFMRVYNYSSTAGGYDSVQQYIKNAYGSQANSYIETLMNDLNGGARTDPSADGISKGLALWKKAKVFTSASVVIQQPSAIARAMAYIDSKYFVDKPSRSKHKETWAEVKKYAPVAIIKEMGYFDTNMGRSTVDFITSREYDGIKEKVGAVFTDSDYRDEILSKGPALADELAWCAIWKAVKRETLHTHPNLRPNSEEFLKAVGERFTEVITKTQVYDSVLSRSAMMRSKDTGMKMATAFMAEPTTALNMAVDAIIEGKRGNKKFAVKALGSVAVSIILNSILVSIVYAWRDDDEDETYIEKYLESLTTELIDGFNPLTYIPFVKDIWSIMLGFDIERSDMSIVADVWASIENLFNEGKSGFEKVEGVVGNISACFGLPLGNIMRDARGMYNLATTLMSDIPTTKFGVRDAVAGAAKNSIPLYTRIERWVGADDSKSDKLYEAIMSGDQKHIDRVKSQYKDQNAINSAIRKALRENDPRIKEAAEALVGGEYETYTDIINEIVGDGFSEKDVKAAIDSEVKDMTPKEESDNSANSKEESLYEVEYVYDAIIKGDTKYAATMREDIISTAVANGKSRKEAEESFVSSFRTHVGKMYKSGEVNRSVASNMLINHGGYDSNEAYWKLKEWDFRKANGEDVSYSKYNDFYDAVKTGKNLKAVIKEYTDHGVTTKTLASQITSYYKPLYKNMTNGERASIKGYLLNAYEQLGYKRYEKSKDIDKWLEE